MSESSATYASSSAAASSSASDSDFIGTPVQGPGTHVPNLALDNVEEEDCPFVYMHILNEMIAAKTSQYISRAELELELTSAQTLTCTRTSPWTRMSPRKL